MTITIDGAGKTTTDENGHFQFEDVVPGKYTVTVVGAGLTPVTTEETMAEPYVYFDPVTRGLVDRHESMRVAWFATGGSFDADRTGRDEDEHATPSSDDVWTAPDAAGTVHLWVVLRDARGGIDWKAFVVDVQ